MRECAWGLPCGLQAGFRVCLVDYKWVCLVCAFRVCLVDYKWGLGVGSRGSALWITQGMASVLWITSGVWELGLEPRVLVLRTGFRCVGEDHFEGFLIGLRAGAAVVNSMQPRHLGNEFLRKARRGDVSRLLVVSGLTGSVQGFRV